MSKTKIIKFYQFEPQPSMQNNGLTPMSTIDVLKSVFPNCNSYDITYDNDKYIVDILEIGNNYVFGKCAKENPLLYTNFYQTRDKITMETFPYSSDSLDRQLEVYTFFYIDCEQHRMAAIQHKNITKIHKILSEAIWTLSKNNLNVFIEPERIKNIKKTAKKIKRNKKLSITFAPNTKSKYNIDSLSDALGGINYESFSIDIKLSQSNNDNAIDRVFEKFENDKESFTDLKLIGKNDSGIEETIDFIETLFTQSANFDITEDTVYNYDIIKNKLVEFLKLKQ